MIWRFGDLEIEDLMIWRFDDLGIIPEQEAILNPSSTLSTLPQPF
jgi:hypothetical protein